MVLGHSRKIQQGSGIDVLKSFLNFSIWLFLNISSIQSHFMASSLGVLISSKAQQESRVFQH